MYISNSFYHTSEIKGGLDRCVRAGIQQNSPEFPLGICAANSPLQDTPVGNEDLNTQW